MSNAQKTKEFKPTDEQIIAINHEGSDLLISAGAGSGKTATLTDRIVGRICDKDKDISRMLVVTFTNDAANELKIRISKKLGERLKKDPTNTRICSQITKVTSADISTIHSFCLRVLKPHFDKLGLDSDFRIGEENELDTIKSEAINEIIDEFYESDVQDSDFLLVTDCYTSFNDSSTLDSSLLALYKSLTSTYKGLDLLLEPPQVSEEFLSTKYGQVIVKKIQRLVDRFLPIVAELYKEIASDESNKNYMASYAELDDILSRLSNALKNPKYSLIKGIFDDYIGVSFLKGASKSQMDKKYIKYIRDDAQKWLDEIKKDFFYTNENAIKSTIKQNEKICKAIYKVLSAFDERYKEKKRKYNLCDFNDLERYTIQLFYDKEGNVTEIAKEVSQRYDELYIDEYQDVNTIQDKIFLAIERNNRFMVGDIKQSIYGFRASEPRLFSEYRDSFLEYSIPCEDKSRDRSLFMSDNFRCDSNIIAFTNHVSDYMFLNSKGFKYVEGDRLKPSKIQDDIFVPLDVSLHIIDKSQVSKGIYAESELDPQSEYVAKEIRRLIDEEYLPDGRKIEPKHIAILLRTSKDCIDKYVEALNRYNVKNEYVQDVDFFEKPHISLLLSLLNAIDNPSKDVYFAGALHSHIWDFSLEELVKIKSHSPREYSLYSAFENYKKDDELSCKVEALLKTLNEYRDGIKKMSADEAISYIMTSTGLLSSCNKYENEDLIKLYNMACIYEKSSYKGLYSFLRYIEDSASKKKLSEVVSDDPSNCVKLLTMHKSKGLEYEICFLCDTEKQFSRKSYTQPILFDKELGICGYVSRDGGIIKYNNILRKCASLSIQNREKEEAMRLLYVAMTRARSKLYITANITKPQDAEEKHQRLSHLVDEYNIYSKKSHIEYIMGSCASLLEYVDFKIIDPNSIVPVKEQPKEDSKYDSDLEKSYTDMLKERFNTPYKYEYLNKIPSKLSISTLEPEILDENENEEYTMKRYNIDSIPKFLENGKSEITGAQRGTATHVFLQFCDFENLLKNGVEHELSRLIDNAFISKAIGDIIHKSHIEKFISSEIIKEFLQAKNVIREFRFNLLLDAKEFSSDPNITKEKVLVQGVTDCIYENEQGELILVDYKTDSVTEQNYVSLLKEKHSLQLTYYKRACELMFERPISKVLIYSVPLGKTVEI